MKARKIVVTILLVTGIVMMMSPAAMAGRAKNTGLGQTDYDIPTDQGAPGTKYTGPLTIVYEFTPGAFVADATVYMRLRQGKDLLPFGGSIGTVIYSPDDAGATGSPLLAVEAFISNTVIPVLYGCTAGSDCPPASIKFVDQFVEDLPTPCCGGLFFDIMDVTIAVAD